MPDDWCPWKDSNRRFYLRRAALDGWVILIAGWEFNGDELRFTDIRSGIGVDPFAEVMWGGKPWTRIG
ncbi:MAG: hypothetical protein M3381_06370 [Actinomycetota bacterium]|nr:hypothetical protein [Actinomycetota bacterium]